MTALKSFFTFLLCICLFHIFSTQLTKKIGFVSFSVPDFLGKKVMHLSEGVRVRVTQYHMYAFWAEIGRLKDQW